MFSSNIVTKERLVIVYEYKTSSESLIGCSSNYPDDIISYYELVDLFDKDEGNRYIKSNGDDRNKENDNLPYHSIYITCSNSLDRWRSVLLIDNLNI